MASAFKIYRIVCATPPDLNAERQVFESTLADFAERVTFPEQILFAGASFREGFDVARHRTLAESNVRMCDFFLHIFGETWPAPAFKDFITLALECAADSSQPMRNAAVLFRNPADADEQVRRFRDELGLRGNCELREFKDSQELEAQLREVFAGWHAAVKQNP